jgi:hypothetical protein
MPFPTNYVSGSWLLSSKDSQMLVLKQNDAVHKINRKQMEEKDC